MRTPDPKEILVTSWLPALDGVVAKLERGAKVADVGCGLGASTILMAQAFPKARFFGYDAHPKSIALARQRAAEAGVADRVTFEVSTSTDFPGHEYDLVCHFDCLHDMENPVGTARRAKDALAPGGTWMIVEPFAQAGEARLRKIVTDAGFPNFRRATESPLDLVVEAQL